jgi:hypothetical protein
MYPRPTRFQIMRARRAEFDRGVRLQAARAELETHLDEYQIGVLRDTEKEIRAVMSSLPAAQTLIAKIDECERQEVAKWHGPPRPHVAYGVLREDVREPHHHPTGWISRLFWWRYGS